MGMKGAEVLGNYYKALKYFVTRALIDHQTRLDNFW
jgi:hypothetical protein